MDPKDYHKDHKFRLDEFEVLVSLSSNYLALEALNSLTFQTYVLSLTDEDVFRLSHNYFTKTTELFEVLTSFFEENPGDNQGALVKGQVFVKFRRKSLSFQFRIQMGAEQAGKNLTFSLDLAPRNPNKDLQGIQSRLEDLKSRVAKIEGYLMDVKTIDERIQALERKYQEFADHKPMNPTSSPNIETKETTNVETAPVLTFSPTVNNNFFTFKNKNATIVRTGQSRKNHIVAWGSTPLKKNGLEFFYYKVEGLNKGFQYINACVGIMTSNLLGKVANLAEHDGNGCYFYGVNAQCIWINNTKESVECKHGKEGDVFKVLVNFANMTIVWQIENKEIGRGMIDEKQAQQFEFYPAVTLAYPRESISLI